MLRKPIAVGLLLGLILVLAGCARPSIDDATGSWAGSPQDRILRAEVSVPSGWQLNNVFVRFTRHFWPGPRSANHGSAFSRPGDRSRFFFTPPGALSFPDSHTLFYEWFMEYQLAGGGTEVFTARSGRNRLVVGCTRDDMRRSLAGPLTAFTALLSTETPHKIAPARGFSVPTHLNASIRNNGLAFGIPPTEIPTAAGVDLSQPTLAFYAPRPREIGESVADFNLAVGNAVSIDGPYSFIGLAYTAQYEPGRRPTVGCIPTDLWFVHEAGYHKLDGSMALTAPDDNGVRGSATITGAPDLQLGIWHPRFWDLHVWLPPDGNPQNPIVVMNRPGGVGGLQLDDDAFFRSEVFE